MAQSSDDEKKVRFYKFWQAVQLTEGLDANEAVAVAVKRSQDPTNETPGFFRGEVSAAPIHALVPNSTEDLEKGVIAFRDPFLLNKAFPMESASAKRRKVDGAPDAMDVDTGPEIDSDIGRVPGV